MAYVLGVDLGTTFTAAAVGRDGKAEMAMLGNRTASLPSVVYLEADGTTTIGEPAERRGLDDPTRLAREFKRRIGDPTPMLVGGAPLAADVLTGRLLEAVIAAVATREGAPPDAVAITHPANWGPYKTDLLEQAARRAGVADAVLVSEPVAAATSYASTERVPVGTVVAVYDLGGGTFDAAVLRKTDTGFEVLGHPEGIERLGGIDVDQAVLAHVDRVLGGTLAELDPDDPAARSAGARLRRECVEAKEALSDDTDATIGVYLPDRSDQVRLTRGELEDMVRPSLLETVACLHRAIRSAGLEPEQVDRVLLVGGASRMPLVAELVGAEMGRPVAVDAHPKHAIALGAALLAMGAPTSAATDAGVEPATSAAISDLPIAEPPAPAPAAPPPAAAPPAPEVAPAPASPTPEVTPAAAAAPTPAPSPEPAPAPAPASAGAPAPATAPAAGRSKVGLIAGVAVAAVVAVVVAVVLLGGGGDGGDTSTDPLQLVSFSVDDSGGECTATWSFEGDPWEDGDQLWLYWNGEPVAKGDAVSSATQAGGDLRFDEMALVRDGEVVQRWQPQGSC